MREYSTTTPRPPVAAGSRHPGPAAQPGGYACGRTDRPRAGGSRSGVDPRAGGRRPGPDAAAGVRVGGRARLRPGHRPADGRVRSLPARDRRHAGRGVPGAVRVCAQHHGRDDRRGRGRPDAGRPHRPGAGTAGRGGARTAEPPALPRRLSRAVPRMRGAWDELPADHGHQQVDSRWAALQRLTE